ncbi:hypothetical protein [Sphingomonas fennica]|uniref:Energy transducer TonB n=1 Tax=Edaphosphingomonas fennica TaxID=114404 RepID=A0A2T4HZ92_9SPHN|nr:hypothetical protein [Sphingomonas fennica]PTD21662.1 hypothetical protein CV103_10410 [Sphingomonas fennica]
MPPASYQPSSYRNEAPLHRRAGALFVAIAANVLLVVMLIRIAAMPPSEPTEPTKPLTVELLPDTSTSSTPSKAAEKKRSAEAASQRSRAPRAVPVPTPTQPPPAQALGPLKMLILTPEEFAASDISKLPSHTEGRATADASTAGSGAGQDSSSDGPGSGPNGERLYNAEWYRPPTNAELNYYLPANAPRVGTGLIACRTAPNYRVEDCREIADAPPGSGLARAIRQAAWQFRVLPPRIGGRPMVGAWVRIRIDFTERGAN